jgi:predicted Zn-dependent peptidase
MVDRSVAPEFIVPQKFTLPKPKTISFEHGHRLYCLNAGDQPVIKLEFVFSAGSWYETIPGQAFFTGKMLLEGTASWSSSEIAEKLDRLGAFVEAQAGPDYIHLSIHVPTRHFEKLKPILTELLFKATFPQSELNLLKKIQIQQMRINNQRNSYVASRMFRSGLYGDRHYGHVITEDSIDQINSSGLQEYFSKWMQGRFDIFLTGRFDDALPDQICNLVADQMKPRQKGTINSIEPQDHFSDIVEKEDSLQSAIFMGKRTINKQDDRFPVLLLLNEVFGGFFGSRLMQNIREDKGYTYSIYSHLATMKNDAYLVINSEVKKDKRSKTIDEILREIESLKNLAIPEEELAQAKNYLKGSILNSLTTPFALTEKLKNILLYDLDEHFYDKLFNEIDATNADELMHLANSLLFDEQLNTIVVG